MPDFRTGLPGQFLDDQGIAGLLSRFRTWETTFAPFSPWRLSDKHVDADKSEHDHIGDLDQKIRIAHVPQDFYDLHADGAADDAADEQKNAHFEIHIAQTIMGQGA